MSVSTPPVYVYTLNDIPGVVAANNFMAFMNPSTSGKVVIALQGIFTTYASAVSTTPNSLLTQRISASSGGTLIAASTIARFRSDFPDPANVVRIDNPTVTTSGLVLTAHPPVVSTGTGTGAASITSPPGASFVFGPGEGLVFRTAAGDVDQVWNMTYVWMEIDA